MRGKKIDTEFVATFVAECVTINKISTEDICEEAKKQIANIDAKIKEVEQLKKKRSKLCDVIISFDEVKKDTSKDKLLLDFHKIQNKEIARAVVKLVEKEKLYINVIVDKLDHVDRFLPEDAKFIIKQMIELEIVSSDQHGNLSKGSAYSDFIHFMKKNYPRNVK